MTRRRFLGRSLGAAAGTLAVAGPAAAASAVARASADAGGGPVGAALCLDESDLARLAEAGLAPEAIPGVVIGPAGQGGIAATIVDTRSVARDDPRLLSGGVPFGLEPSEQLAWLHGRGGVTAIEAALRAAGRVARPLAFAAAPRGLWTRREPATLEQLRDWTVAAPSAARPMLERAGVRAVPLDAAVSRVVVGLPPKLDAVASGGPAFDAAHGLDGRFAHRVVDGWRGGAELLWLETSASGWDGLPAERRGAIEQACETALLRSLARVLAAARPAGASIVERGADRASALPHAVADALAVASREALAALARDAGPALEAVHASYVATLDSLRLAVRATNAGG